MENITENNKLIAEFMGYKYIGFNNNDELKPGWWKDNIDLLKIQSQEIFNRKMGNPNFLCRKHNELRYYNSWNWLMPVVEKIESIKDSYHGRFGVYINSNSCTIQSTNFRPDKPIPNPPHYDYNIVLNNKIESVYYSVINFINFYNKQKEG